MTTPFRSVKREIAEALRVALEQIGFSVLVAEVEETVGLSKFAGDISSSIALKIAKQSQRGPQEIISAIRSSIKLPSYVQAVTTENSFINFHLNKTKFSDMVITDILQDGSDAVCSDVGRKRKVMIEYPSANPVHPLHMGHLRNMLLGDAIARFHTLCGYAVQRQDYIDDLGLQAAAAIWGVMQTMVDSTGKKFDHWLGEIYVDTNKRIEQDEKVKNIVAETLRYMEDTNTKESKMARSLGEQCTMAHHETEFNYGIVHDLLIWESDIVREGLLQKAMDLLSSKQIARKELEGKYAGCTLMIAKSDSADSEQGEAKVLIRSNGVATYFAKDIAFHMWKFGILPDPFRYAVFTEFGGKKVYTSSEQGDRMDFAKTDIAINIIDSRQDYPQMLLKQCFELMGSSRVAANLSHLSYGVVELESGSLSGRKGTWVGNTADDLLAEAKSKAMTLIGSRFSLGEDEKSDVATKTALAAIKFEFLRSAPEKNMVFSWKRALSFEGDSGPYCQYMCARAIRLIQDSKVDAAKIRAVDTNALADSHSFALIKQLSLASEMVEKACRELRPNVITDYVIDLATAYSRFYEHVPVLKQTTEEEKLARIGLTIAFRDVMSAMLDSIGISTIERM